MTIDDRVAQFGELFCLDHDDKILLRSLLEFQAEHDAARERVIAELLEEHAGKVCDRLSAELTHVLGFPVRVSSPLAVARETSERDHGARSAGARSSVAASTGDSSP